MNITLIFEKRKCNFDISNNSTIKYIKTLCSKIFKCPSLDICYKNINISNEKKETTKLKEIISKDETNITLTVSKKKPEVVLKDTFSSKNSSETTDIKTISEPSSENKSFDTTYSRKYKSLIFILKDLNNKIIDIDNYFFRQTKTSKNSIQETMNIFEKRVNEFVGGLVIYYKKISTALNNVNESIKNDNDYDKFIQSLNQFYNEITFNDENNESNNEADTGNSSPKNKITDQSQITTAEKVSRNTKNSFADQEHSYNSKTPKLPMINPTKIVIPLFLQEKEKEEELKKTKKKIKINQAIFNSEVKQRRTIPLINVNEEKNEETTSNNGEDNQNENVYYTSRNSDKKISKLNTKYNKSIDNIIHDIKKQNSIDLMKKKENFEENIAIPSSKDEEKSKLKIIDYGEENETKENNLDNISKLVHDLTEIQKSPKKEKHCGFMLSTKNVCHTEAKRDLWDKMKGLNLKSRKDLDMRDLIKRQTTKKRVNKSLNKFDFLI